MRFNAKCAAAAAALKYGLDRNSPHTLIHN